MSGACRRSCSQQNWTCEHVLYGEKQRRDTSLRNTLEFSHWLSDSSCIRSVRVAQSSTGDVRLVIWVFPIKNIDQISAYMLEIAALTRHRSTPTCKWIRNQNSWEPPTISEDTVMEHSWKVKRRAGGGGERQEEQACCGGGASAACHQYELCSWRKYDLFHRNDFLTFWNMKKWAPERGNRWGALPENLLTPSPYHPHHHHHQRPPPPDEFTNPNPECD